MLCVRRTQCGFPKMNTVLLYARSDLLQLCDNKCHRKEMTSQDTSELIFSWLSHCLPHGTSVPTRTNVPFRHSPGFTQYDTMAVSGYFFCNPISILIRGSRSKCRDTHEFKEKEHSWQVKMAPSLSYSFSKVGDTPTSPTQVLCYTHESCTFILVEFGYNGVCWMRDNGAENSSNVTSDESYYQLFRFAALGPWFWNHVS